MPWPPGSAAGGLEIVASIKGYVVVRYTWVSVVLVFLLSATALGAGVPMDDLANDVYAGFEERANMIMRRAANNPSPSPDTPWGAINQAMGILWLDEMRARWPEANRALEALGETAPIHPHDLTEPAIYWGLGALVRTYFLFHQGSEFFPGRLTPAAEDAIKGLLWDFVYGRSRLDDAHPEQVWTIFDSENHDMMHKTVYYLAAVILAQDPLYSDSIYNDGGTPAEHEAAWAEWFKVYLKTRATHGLWVEQNSSTYVKYTLSALVNLYDFSRDPSVRQRVGMTLDITLIDWAQEQIMGVRGGGAARTISDSARMNAEVHSMWGISWLLFRDVGGFAYQPSQQLFATSRYRPSEFAVGLALWERSESYEVMNRVLGSGNHSTMNLMTLARQRFGETPVPTAHHRYRPPVYTLVPNSRILHYTYVTPHYVLGMNMMDPNTRYTMIAAQSLWAGAIMPTQRDVSARIFAAPIDAAGDGVHFDAFWGVQHRSAMILQKTRHAQGVDGMRIYLSPSLQRTEQDGWIFATNGRAFAGIKVAWGDYRWSGQYAVLSDADSPFILQMGTIEEYSSLQDFIDAVLSAPLTIDGGRIVYQGPGAGELTFYFEPRSGLAARDLGRYILPEVDGTPVDFAAASAYSSPFLHGEWGGPRVVVRLGTHRAVFDFDANEVVRTEVAPGEAESRIRFSLRSPQEEATVQGPTPVEASAESTYPIQEVQVGVNGETIYQGSQMPQGLTINQGELSDGEHVLTLTAVDQRGEAFRRSYRFHVSNLRVVAPRFGERVAGPYRVEIDTPLTDAIVSQAAIRVADQEVYRGPALPRSFVLDTLAFDDGAYELSVEVQTTQGALASDRVEFRVQNYWRLEDNIEAPALNWFGTMLDRSMTVDASSGWEYFTGSSHRTFASRIVRLENTTEYLTWDSPSLDRFHVDLLAADAAAVASVVRLEVSADGDTWIGVPFDMITEGLLEDGWYHLRLTGDRLPAIGTRLFRLTLHESDTPAQAIQIGRVHLIGLQAQQNEE